MKSIKLISHNIFLIFLFVSILTVTATSSYAQGGLSVGQTRVIFDEEMKNTKIALTNRSDRVYLINTRILTEPDGNGQISDSPPFLATPPIFRLEKESRNAVVISRNDTSHLPTDRESIFYLSLMAIPSVQKQMDDQSEGATTQVSVGIRTVIKMFYRPTGLTLAASSAADKLKFIQQGDELQVVNPTPYYLTLAELSFNEQLINVRDKGAMIAPFSTQSYPVNSKLKTISWSVINDYGGLSETFHWLKK